MKINIELEYDDLSDTQREGLKMLVATREQHKNEKHKRKLLHQMALLSRDMRLGVGEPQKGFIGKSTAALALNDALINKKGHKRPYSRKKPRGKVLNKLIVQTLGTTDRPMTIRELVKSTKGGYSTISCRLSEMRKAGIVDATSNHKNRLYFLRKPRGN